jgi:hypothetical protein
MTARLLLAFALVWPLGIAASRADSPWLRKSQEPPDAVRQTAAREREARLAALRARAQQRIAEDATRYSASELTDIEARYRATRRPFWPVPAPDHDARFKLQELVETYRRSNRAGCAVLELAQMSEGRERERYLKAAIADHDDAWFENGAQVGPLARALLAMLYAGVDRLDEAERLAGEIASRYPGSVDTAGAPLDDVLPALKMLRPPR